MTGPEKVRSKYLTVVEKRSSVHVPVFTCAYNTPRSWGDAYDLSELRE